MAWKDGSFSYHTSRLEKSDKDIIDYQSGMVGSVVERFPITSGKVKTKQPIDNAISCGILRVFMVASRKSPGVNNPGGFCLTGGEEWYHNLASASCWKIWII